MHTETVNSEAMTLEELEKGFSNLHKCFHPQDVSKVAFELNINAETVRRYMRGSIMDIDTANRIYPILYRYTVERLKGYLSTLQAA